MRVRGCLWSSAEFGMKINGEGELDKQNINFTWPYIFSLILIICKPPTSEH